ncbi:MAG: sensor histidine kinase [Polyangiaceae bacterium]|nr:sensor histidine kinase [Polyangiaceae bacterium]
MNAGGCCYSLNNTTHDLATPLTVLGDVTLLEQALSNLVQNAIKHNRPGGHVAVLLERDVGQFFLDVIDDGPGIPEDELRRLLRAGERGEQARTRDPEGRGLGLAIAARVASAHSMQLLFSPSEFGGLRVRLQGDITPILTE